ncbi:class A beta-lactamase [Sphingosinicella sp. LHD-64]|uniref:class A beta-lactamase n=1 Tax=Sphingosinicella sp. LHD-64 TaxID=3072139 RepID=UPI0028108F4B|nr:class A beta-lactamase [Sphingosinicella sp. LHD-64]MDQ8754905.1 class A beta-lactamase [Sphingosinicella sp. LHD-64]
MALTAAVLVGFAPQANSAQTRSRPDAPPTYAPRPATIAQRALDVRIGALGRNFDGLVGIAVREVETGWTTSWNGERHFPQQSVSKFWVALTAFSRIDAGELSPDDRVTIRRQDLTLFHQPVAAEIGANGYTTTLDNLIFRAITQSDNTCNDAVLRRAGGPEAVRAMLTRNRIEGIRFGPGERLMQSQIAGLQWRPSYSVGRAFYQARSAVPEDRRREAFQNYVEDPIDGATPLGIIDGLSRLQRGELLSQRSTARLLSIMSQTRTGRQRLTGGLAPGWRIAHKTGTGQVLGATQAGYNDIGILTSPEGRHYAVAVMMGRTAIPIPQRMALMQDVTRAVIAYNDASRAEGTGSLR